MTMITLPEPTQTWIAAQVAAGRFPDAASYLAALVERDADETRRLRELNAAIDEGIASGISELSVEEIFEKARRTYLNGAR